MIGIFQGDSYARDYSSASVATFDATWVGKWALVFQGVPSLSGELSKSDDITKMLLKLHSSDTKTLAPGLYTLVIQISNDLLDFKQESQELLLVKSQGIPD